jgi:hypothetical protein
MALSLAPHEEQAVHRDDVQRFLHSIRVRGAGHGPEPSRRKHNHHVLGCLLRTSLLLTHFRSWICETCPDSF